MTKGDDCPIGKELDGKIKVLEEKQNSIRNESDRGDEIINEKLTDIKKSIVNIEENQKELLQSFHAISIDLQKTNGTINGFTESINSDIAFQHKIITEIKEDHEKRLRKLEGQKGRWIDRILSAVAGGGAAVALGWLLTKLKNPTP